MTGIDRALYRRVAALALTASMTALGIAGTAVADEATDACEVVTADVAEVLVVEATPSVDWADDVMGADAVGRDAADAPAEPAADEAGEQDVLPEADHEDGSGDVADGGAPSEAPSEDGDPFFEEVPLDGDGDADATDLDVDEASTPEATQGAGVEAGADDLEAAVVEQPCEDVDEGKAAEAEPEEVPPTALEAAADTPETVAVTEEAPSLQGAQAVVAADPAPAGTWVTEGGSTYYRLSDGTNQVGHQFIDGAWYYLDPANNGARAVGVREVADGTSTLLCLFGTDGKQRFGEAQVNGAWCYFDPDRSGAQSRSAFVSLTGSYLDHGPKTVYYDSDGHMVYGELNLNKGWYYLAPDTGARAEAEFVRLNGSYLDGGPKTVYYRQDGTMAHGEVQVDDDWYYTDPASGAMVSDRLVALGNGDKAYQGKDGKRVMGEAQVQGSWYYFDPEHGGLAARSRFVELTGSYLDHGPKTVYYDRFGRMLYGELNLNGAWHYLQPSSGALVKNGFVWLTGDYLDGGAKVVFYDEDGRMAHGEKTVEGKRFSFDPVTGATDALQYWQWRLAQAPSSGLIPGTDVKRSLVDAVNLSVNRFYEGGYAVGFVMMDLSTGKGMTLNADSDFYAASSIKGPYVASLYRNTFGSSDAEGPYYRTMLDAIADSSNGDYAYLRRQFGTAGFSAFLSRSGVDVDKSEVAYPWYSPRDLGKLWLQMGEYFNATPVGRECADLYTHSYNSSIYYELGAERPVQSKPGWYPTEYPYTSTNDAGIVYAPTGAYMVAVLSNAPVRLDLTQGLIRSLDNLHTGMF